jgi:alpha-1,3-glucosyltransferase
MPCTCQSPLPAAYLQRIPANTVHSYVETSPTSTKRAARVAALSILFSPGLLIIDHIHFQYNGFLYGLLILSLVLARKKSTLLLSGILFAALLMFKHIYLYLAPAYFVYLLRAYCLGPKSIFHIRFGNAIKLGVGILAVFAAALGPFAYWGQIPQLLSRLFPFSRGLCHAYWAPNVWAMYSFTDRILIYRSPSHCCCILPPTNPPQLPHTSASPSTPPPCKA